MPRGVTSQVLAVLVSQSTRPVIFVEAHFATYIAYLWSGIGSIDWNSHTWAGIGSFGSISTVEEGSTVEAKGITLTLSGIDSTLLHEVVGDFALGLPALVYLGFRDGSGNIIANPILSFAGRMDQPTVTVGGETAVISINCESRLVDLNTPAFRRYTSEDQNIDFPNDVGFAFVPSIIDISFFWGNLPGGINNFTSRGS